MQAYWQYLIDLIHTTEWHLCQLLHCEHVQCRCNSSLTTTVMISRQVNQRLSTAILDTNFDAVIFKVTL